MKKTEYHTIDMRNQKVNTVKLAIFAILFAALAHTSLHADIASVNASPNTSLVNPAIHLVDGDDTTSWKLTPGSVSGWAELALSGNELVYGLSVTGSISPNNRFIIEYKLNGNWVPFTCAYMTNRTFQNDLIDLSYDEAVTDGIRFRLAGNDCSQSGISEISFVTGNPLALYHKLAVPAVTSSHAFPEATTAENLFDGEVSTYWHCMSSYLYDDYSGEIRRSAQNMNIAIPAVTYMNATVDFPEPVHCTLMKFYLERAAAGTVTLTVLKGGTWETVSTFVNPAQKGWYRAILDGSSISGARIELSGQVCSDSGIGEMELWGTGSYPGSEKETIRIEPGTALTAPVTFRFVKQGNGKRSIDMAVQGISTAAINVKMNEKTIAVAPGIVINNNTVYSLELNDCDLVQGENFLTLQPGVTILSILLKGKDNNGRVDNLPDGTGDRLYLHPVAMTPDVSYGFDNPLSCEAINVYTMEEIPPGIELITGTGNVPLSLVKDGNVYRATINGMEAEGIRVTNGNGTCEIEILGSRTKPKGPEPQLLWPHPEATSTLLNAYKEYALAYVDDVNASVTINEIQTTHYGHYFFVSYAAQGIVPGVKNAIEIRAVDTEGNTGIYSTCMIVIPQSIIALNQPDQIIYTQSSPITLSGNVTVSNCKLFINGVEAVLSKGSFNAQVPVSDGYNLITIEARTKTGNSVLERVTRRAVKTGSVGVTIDIPRDGTVTNKSAIQVSGPLTGWGPYSVTVNGVQAAVSGNTYNAGPVPLVEGDNTIIVTASDTTGHSAQAQVAIVRDTTLPVLSNVIPQDGYMTTAGTVTVSGQVSDVHAAYVLVNGKTANFSGSAFSLAVALPEDGTHTITIAAFDAAGNKSIDHVLTVIRDTTPAEDFELSIEPPSWTNDTTPTLTFNTTDSLTGVVRYELSIDGGAAAVITSPHTLTPQPDGVHDITVTAYNGVGLATPASGHVYIDTVPSAPPADFLAVSCVTTNRLTWTDDKDENLGYVIFRTPAFAEHEFLYVLRSQELPTADHYTDTAVTPGNTYAYSIQTLDKAGNYGALSPVQFVKTGIEEEPVGSEGGVVRFDDVVIQVGEDVFDEGDTLVIEERDEPLPENEFAAGLGKVYSVKRLNASGVEVTGDFTEPVSMSLSYKDMLPEGSNVGYLGLYLWNEELSIWEKLRGVYNDYASQTLTVDLHHFSDYAPMVGTYTPPNLEEYEKLGVNPFKDYFSNNIESVSSSGGNLSVTAIDALIPGKDGLDLVISRSYNSSGAEQYGYIEADMAKPPANPPNPDEKRKKHTEPVVTFGWGWSLDIPMVETTEDGKYVILPEGQKIKIEGSTFEYHKGVHFTLVSTGTGYTLTMADGTQYDFDTNGRPTKKTSPSGKQTITYAYSTTTTKQLTKIIDTFGNEAIFTYNANGFIDTITVPSLDGTATHTYGYDANKCLVSYTDPKGRVTQYGYETYENVKTGVLWSVSISGRCCVPVCRNPFYIQGIFHHCNDVDPQEDCNSYSGGGSSNTRLEIDLHVLNTITYPTGGISAYTYDFRPDHYENTWQSGGCPTESGSISSNTYKLLIKENEREGKTTTYAYNTNMSNPPASGTPVTGNILPPNTYIYGCTINDGLKIIEEKYNLLFGDKLSATYQSSGTYWSGITHEYNGNMLVERTIKDIANVPFERVDYTYNLPIRAVTKETHNRGTIVTYIINNTYDGWGNLTETIDSRTEKKVTATFKPHGRIRSLPDIITEYNKNPLTDTTTELSTRYIYSEENTDYSMGKPTRIEVTGGSSQRITEYDYDDNGLILTVTNKAKETGSSTEETGLITKFDYIDYDNTSAESFTIRKILFGIKDPDGNDIGDETYDGLTGGIATKSQYDKGTGLLANEWDAAGNEKRYDYDILKRLINATVVGAGPIGEDITRQNVFYDNENRSEYVNERGHAVEFYYSTLGQLTKIVPPLEEGQVEDDFATTYVYDEWGRITDAIKPAPDNVGASVVTTFYEYDSFNRITKMIYPDTKFVTLQYDDATNTVSVYDQHDDLVAEETNDYAGRLVKAIQHNQYASESEALYDWRFNYDSNGGKIRQIDPAGYTTEQSFDAFGRPVQATLPHVEAVVPGMATPQGMNPMQSAVYDKWGNKVKELSANGNATNLANKDNYGVEHEYDVLGREILTRTKATNADTGAVEESSVKTFYDVRGNKVKAIDGNGKAWLFAYDKRNLLISETDPEGRTTAYTYDEKENKVSVTDPRGTATTNVANDYTTWYEYDKRDRLVKTILPDNTPANNTDNPYTTIKYDKAGNKAEEKDADGLRTKYTYTLKNQVKTKGIISKDDNETTLVTYAYDKKGNLVSEIDNNEHTTSYAYDRLGRLRKVTYPDTSCEEYTYDKLGNKLTVKDRRGNTTTTAYNSMGWVTRTTDPLLEETTYLFDPNGNNVSLTKPNGLVYKSVYDEQNRIVKTIDSIGQIETVSYDKNGNVIKKTDVRDTVWEYLYDDANMLEHIYANKQTDGTSDYHCAYTYDDAGNKLTETDDGNTITYTPNELNRITNVTKQFDSSTYTMDYGYTPGGLLTSLTYPGATEPVTYTYDSYNSLEEIVGFTQPNSITYDDMFNLTGYTTMNGTATTLSYDVNDRLDTLTVAKAATSLMSFDYTRDPTGNITAINDMLTNKTRQYQYDELNQMKNANMPVSKTESEHTPGEAGIAEKDYEGKKAIDYGTDPSARISVDYNSRSIGIKFSKTAYIKTLEMTPEESAATHRIENRSFDIYTSNDNGAYTLVPKTGYTYTKDDKGKITIIFNERLVTLFLKIHVLFDDRDRSFTPTNQAEFINTLARILTVYQESEYVNEWFAYDENGNRIRRDLTLVRTFTESSNYYQNTERLKSDGNWVYTYDKAGNIVEKGNTVEINATPYSVKSEEAYNYLASITSSIGSIAYVEGGENVEYWKYSYDLLNRLVKVEKNGIIIAEYTYDPNGYRTTKQANGNTIHYVYQGNRLIFEKNITTSEIKSYVYAFGKHLARVNGTVDSGTAGRYYYSTDHIGSVRMVTDEDGDVVWKGEYSAFGKLFVEERLDETYDAEIIYAGHMLDVETGLYYAKMRYYDASTGRFISVDPAKDGSNWYVYSLNNPLRFTDPTGLWTYDSREAAAQGEYNKQAAANRKSESDRIRNLTYHYSNLAQAGLFNPFDYAYYNRKARDEAMKYLKANADAYATMIRLGKTELEKMGFNSEILKGETWVAFTTENKIDWDPNNPYEITEKIAPTGYYVYLVSYKDGKMYSKDKEYYPANEENNALFDYAMRLKVQMVQELQQKYNVSPFTTYCNFGPGIIATYYGVPNLQNSNGKQYTQGNWAAQFHAGTFNTNDYIFLETNLKTANEYGGKDGFALVLKDDHTATMLGPNEETGIPQVFSIGWATWRSGITNLGPAFGVDINSKDTQAYDNVGLRYFILIKNPEKKK